MTVVVAAITVRGIVTIIMRIIRSSSIVLVMHRTIRVIVVVVIIIWLLHRRMKDLIGMSSEIGEHKRGKGNAIGWIHMELLKLLLGNQYWSVLSLLAHLGGIVVGC